MSAANISLRHNSRGAAAFAKQRLIHRTQIKGGKPFFDPKTLDLRA